MNQHLHTRSVMALPQLQMWLVDNVEDCHPRSTAIDGGTSEYMYLFHTLNSLCK
jgi:hypothetical protein